MITNQNSYETKNDFTTNSINKKNLIIGTVIVVLFVLVFFLIYFRKTIFGLSKEQSENKEEKAQEIIERFENRLNKLLLELRKKQKTPQVVKIDFEKLLRGFEYEKLQEPLKSLNNTNNNISEKIILLTNKINDEIQKLIIKIKQN
jgi:hypothetical protein